MGRPDGVRLSARSALGPPSEGDFVRALRDRALSSVDLHTKSGVLGHTPAELEQLSGLSRPSVSNLIKRFEPVLQPQTVEGETPAEESARRWAIDPKAGVAVGVAIGWHGVHVALADLYGRTDASSKSDEAASSETTIDWIVEQIFDLLGTRPRSDVVGLGVSVAAPLDRERGLVRGAIQTYEPSEEASWFDWQLMNVREHLRARLGWDDVPILLDNDANLSALAEHVWGAARPSRLGDRAPYRHVIYIEWSRGIGAGLILDGELFRGVGVAGEIGHTVIRDDPAATICERCGKSGCLQTVVGWDAVLRRLPEYPVDSQLREDHLLQALRSAQQPGTGAQAAFEDAALNMACVLGPLIHTLNPELVIVGGDVGKHGYDVVRSPLLEGLKRRAMRPALEDVTIVPSKLRENPALQGAIGLVLRQSRGDIEALLPFLKRKARS